MPESYKICQGAHRVPLNLTIRPEPNHQKADLFIYLSQNHIGLALWSSTVTKLTV